MGGMVPLPSRSPLLEFSGRAHRVASGGSLCCPLRPQDGFELLQTLQEVGFEMSTEAAIQDLLRCRDVPGARQSDELAEDGLHVLLGDRSQHGRAQRTDLLRVGVPRASSVAGGEATRGITAVVAVS